ncbi:hypothetical protein BJX99DRAFT_261027 [Aspergillus californicus]
MGLVYNIQAIEREEARVATNAANAANGREAADYAQAIQSAAATVTDADVAAAVVRFHNAARLNIARVGNDNTRQRPSPTSTAAGAEVAAAIARFNNDYHARNSEITVGVGAERGGQDRTVNFVTTTAAAAVAATASAVTTAPMRTTTRGQPVSTLHSDFSFDIMMSLRRPPAIGSESPGLREDEDFNLFNSFGRVYLVAELKCVIFVEPAPDLDCPEENFEGVCIEDLLDYRPTVPPSSAIVGELGYGLWKGVDMDDLLMIGEGRVIAVVEDTWVSLVD